MVSQEGASQEQKYDKSRRIEATATFRKREIIAYANRESAQGVCMDWVRAGLEARKVKTDLRPHRNGSQGP